MGYCVDTRDVDVVIPRYWLDEAYRRLCELNNRTDLKQSGRRLPDGTWSSFSYMDEDYPKRCKDAEDIFRALGFDTFFDDEMNLHIDHYNGEKMGDEELFFKTVGDLVVGGSYVEWVGEDGERWRWFFDGSTMIVQQGKVTYD